MIKCDSVKFHHSFWLVNVSRYQKQWHQMDDYGNLVPVDTNKLKIMWKRIEWYY